jgi:hypothetical protein
MQINLVAFLATGLVAAACATNHKPKERAVSGDMIVSNSLCGGYAVRAASKDPPGERMICGWEELVGSHVPKCICHDEKQLEEDQQTAQAYLRDAEHGRCASNGTGTCN